MSAARSYHPAMVRRPTTNPANSVRRHRRPREAAATAEVQAAPEAMPSPESAATGTLTAGMTSPAEAPSGGKPTPSAARGASSGGKGAGSERANGERSPSPLDGLTVAGFTRRRAAFLAGTFATIWIVAVFARQVGDASAATAKADALRADNAAVASDVAALQAELEQIQQGPYVAQQARGYDLGAPNERAFTLAPGAPALPSDAPGSASLRLGGHPAVRSPLDTWLLVLFGPTSR